MGDFPVRASPKQSWLLDAPCVVVAAALVLFFTVAAGFVLWLMFRNVMN